ncbi:MAG: cell division protein FtsK, partial [Streptomycetaceae bacterium]|nr:cell division protein FtsK [Streptomycetaceae bacterium]
MNLPTPAAGHGALRPPDAAPEPPLTVDKPADSSGPGLLARVRGAKRRAVVPAWLRSRQEFRDAGTGVAAYAGHVAAYHALRTPWYALRLTLRAPRGAARVVGGLLRWLVDAEGEPLRQAAATREDVEEYLKLSRQRDRRVRWRTLVGVAASVLGPVAALAAYFLAPVWLLALAVPTAVLGLGRLGQPADDPVIHRAVEIPR